MYLDSENDKKKNQSPFVSERYIYFNQVRPV